MLGLLDQRLLHGMLKIVDDATEELIGGGKLQQVRASLEELADKALPRPAEVGVHQMTGLAGIVTAKSGVLVNHMGLQGALPVELLQRSEVVLRESTLQRNRIGLNRHR